MLIRPWYSIARASSFVLATPPPPSSPLAPRRMALSLPLAWARGVIHSTPHSAAQSVPHYHSLSRSGPSNGPLRPLLFNISRPLLPLAVAAAMRRPDSLFLYSRPVYASLSHIWRVLRSPLSCLCSLHNSPLPPAVLSSRRFVARCAASPAPLNPLRALAVRSAHRMVERAHAITDASSSGARRRRRRCRLCSPPFPPALLPPPSWRCSTTGPTQTNTHRFGSVARNKHAGRSAASICMIFSPSWNRKYISIVGSEFRKTELKCFLFWICFSE